MTTFACEHSVGIGTSSDAADFALPVQVLHVRARGISPVRPRRRVQLFVDSSQVSRLPVRRIHAAARIPQGPQILGVLFPDLG